MASNSLISQLDILLRGDTRNLDASLDKAGAGLSKFKNKANESASDIRAKLGSIGNNVSDAFQNALTSPLSALKSIGQAVGNAILHPIETAKAGIVSLVSTAKEIGTGILGAVVSGISPIATLLKTAFNPSAWISGLAALSSAALSCATSLFTLETAIAIITTGVGAVVISVLAIGAAFLGAGIGAGILASKQANLMGELTKTAKTLGFTTEALSAYQNIAGDTETTTTALAHLERTLSETALNGGQTAASLAMVGLNARELANSTPEEQLNKLAVAFQGVKNQADRLRLSQELFGKSGGIDFARVLGDGPAKLKEFQDKATRFGLSFTAEQGEIVERSNKAWKNWSLGLKGIGNTLAIAFAPAWEYMANLLGDFFGKIATWTRQSLPYFQLLWEGIEAVLNDIKSAAQPVIDWAVSLIESLGSTIKDWTTESIPYIKELWAIFKAGIQTTIEILTPLWDALVEGFKISIEFIGNLIEPFIEGTKAFFVDLASSVGLSIDGGWTDFKDKLLNFLVALEFGFKNWKRVAEYIFDAMKLKALEWLLSFQNMVKSFQDIVNDLIRLYNSIADYIPGTIHIPLELDLPRFSGLEDEITALRTRLASSGDALANDFAKFLDRRLAELNSVAQQVRRTTQQQRGTTLGGQPKSGLEAAEMGSVKAFEIIAGDKAEKQFQVLNDALAEQKRLREIAEETLRETRRRPSLGVART